LTKDFTSDSYREVQGWNLASLLNIFGNIFKILI